MRLVRRRFLKLGLLSTFLSQVPESNKAEASIPREFKENMEISILQGATDETKTQFSIVHRRGLDLNFVATADGLDPIFPDSVKEISFEDHSQVLSKVYFSGLKLGYEYELNLIDSDEKVFESRFFKTLDLAKKDIRFAIASCMSDEFHEPTIWQDMVSQKPDLILFVGDSVYADRNPGSDKLKAADPKQLWRRFCEARKTLEIYNCEKLIPIIATWDDHDFGKNDSGNTYAYITESQRNFNHFFAQDESHCRGLVAGPGVSSAMIFKDQMFLLLDDRSFREKDAPQKENAHWGNSQVQWALELIDNYDGFVWICNGSQIFPSMWFKESVSKEHPKQLSTIVEKLRKRKNRVAFVSGDVHFSEISEIEKEQLGYVTYELTSSSIHSRSLPGIPEIIYNKRRVAATGKRNYLLVDSDYSNETLKMTVASRSIEGKLRFEKDLIIRS